MTQAFPTNFADLSITVTTGLVNAGDGSGFTALPAVTLANGAHGGAAASITLADYSDFQGSASLSTQDVRDAMKLAPSVGAADAGSIDAQLADIPTVAEFEARSLPAADYTVVADLGTVQTGDTYALANGASGFVATKVDTAAIKVVTDALTAASAAKLAKSAGTMVTGYTAITGTLSTTQMTTNLTEATTDHYKGRIVIFVTGALQNQATDVTGYDGATKIVTMTALTEAPGNGDEFILV